MVPQSPCVVAGFDTVDLCSPKALVPLCASDMNLWDSITTSSVRLRGRAYPLTNAEKRSKEGPGLWVTNTHETKRDIAT